MVDDRNLPLRTARAQRCAGEEELALGLTKHGGRIEQAQFWVDWVFACFPDRGWHTTPVQASLSEIF